jgi:hypothetical protein
LFTYLRYNADLSDLGLRKLGISEIHAPRVRKLDSHKQVNELQAIGRAAATEVAVEHFAGFEL